MSGNTLSRENLERVIRQRAIQMGTELGQSQFRMSHTFDIVELKGLKDKERVLNARCTELKTVSALASILKIEVVEELIASAKSHALIQAKEKYESRDDMTLSSFYTNEFEAPEPSPQNSPAPR